MPSVYFRQGKYPKKTCPGLIPIGTVLANYVLMIAKVISGGLIGIDAYLVGVEVDISLGLPALATVGLPDGAVKESKDRVKAAIKNSGYNFPSQRITVNLAPADIRKEGASFDLPIAVGILVASDVVRRDKIKDYLIAGELSLGGRVKSDRKSVV